MLDTSDDVEQAGIMQTFACANDCGRTVQTDSCPDFHHYMCAYCREDPERERAKISTRRRKVAVKKHGTLTAIKAHRSAKDPLCAQCKAKAREYLAKHCGTRNGATAHSWLDEPSCRPCKTALKAYREELAIR